ncbi:integrase catalytic domain-containing protein [Trichonephila clavata]|uniref:Integrase catalytic domain-containing protein n=1 Tax=Trichonephila clavata TaxID=2740835 RepID=A0A8X6KC60_TRICU|nr:integrase catalytic domain-containing protein [Trichonephila clavata]
MQDMAPHQRTKLLQDFLIPHLNRGTFREKLHWINRREGTFRILWKHQSSSRFNAEDCVVYKEWAIAKRLWNPDDKRSPTIAKQRLRAALLKLRNVRCTRKENEYRVYKIEPTIDLNTAIHHNHYSIVHSNQSSPGNHSDNYSTDESNQSYEIKTENHPETFFLNQRDHVPTINYRTHSLELSNQFEDSAEYLESDIFIEQLLHSDLFNNFHLKEKVPLRVLADSGLQVSLLRSSAADFLNLRKLKTDMSVSGLGGSNVNIKSKVKGTPTFNISNSIDALLSADIFFDILKDGKYKLDNGNLILQNTEFGYIISGNSSRFSNGSLHFGLITRDFETSNDTLKSFWEVEEIVSTKCFSGELKKCDEHFLKTMIRDTNGRFCVEMPMKYNDIELGQSKSTAIRRLKLLERRFVQEHQQDFLRILWRPSPEEDIVSQRLKTVTYGTKPAPYLATRCLLQLAHEGKNKYLLAAPVIQNSTYMDDISSGADDFTTAKEMQRQLIGSMKEGCFHLYKWSANREELMKDVPTENKEFLFNENDELVKTLGLS